MLRAPGTTYRLQLNRDMGFDRARQLVPYLHRLGITDLYVSPLLRAREGSSHGYDGTDPTRLNPELGSERAFDALVDALRQRGMGLLLDIVPNHLAASTENPWWAHVLEHGPASPYAAFFDIDWHPGDPELEGRVLLPILGDSLEEVLARGELHLALDAGGLCLRYFRHRLPVDPGTYPLLLAPGGAGAGGDALEALLARARRLPPREAGDPGAAACRCREGEAIKAGLTRLYREVPPVRTLVDRSFHKPPLCELLAAQAYRLAPWREAASRLNYRRFFDVSDLVGVRVEDPRVFAATHAFILQLAREGKVTGLRVDHVDGLLDPPGYLRRLTGALAAEVGAEGTSRAAPGASPRSLPFYVVVEKILTGSEQLRADWPVAGTTGYEFLNALNAVFVDPAGYSRLAAAYGRFVGDDAAFADVVYHQKRKVIRELFPGEFRELAQQAAALTGVSLQALEPALVEVTACLPVYRTYRRRGPVAAEDRALLEEAVAEAGRRNPGLDGPALAALRGLLLGEAREAGEGAGAEGTGARPGAAGADACLAWVMRWQQRCVAVTAKGQEDTALYVHLPLLSLNEVGGGPPPPADPVAVFHRLNQERLARWPLALSATATHDTKRGEDARCRLHVLSELPEEWEARLTRWSRWNAPKRRLVKGTWVPTPREEVLLYQTLLGAWPAREAELPTFPERLAGYLVKAAREAKIHSSWLSPDPAHEDALVAFARDILAPEAGSPFPADFHGFRGLVAFHGALNSLGQVLLKLAAPGVPDTYQGTELWDLSLVDPDNRRPVDFEERQRLLAELEEEEAAGPPGLAARLLATWADGRVKLHVVRHGLRLRRERPELFRKGAYLPVPVRGPRAEHVCAFARRQGTDWALAAAARLTVRLAGPGRFPLGEPVWRETMLVLPGRSPDRWENRLTGEHLATTGLAAGERAIPLATAFRTLPVALLVPCAGPGPAS